MKIRRADEKDLEELNGLLRASKAHWGYDDAYFRDVYAGGGCDALVFGAVWVLDRL